MRLWIGRNCINTYRDGACKALTHPRLVGFEDIANRYSQLSREEVGAGELNSEAAAWSSTWMPRGMIDVQYRRLFDLSVSPVRKLLLMPSREIIPVYSYLCVQWHGVGAGRASGKVLPHVAVMKGEM